MPRNAIWFYFVEIVPLHAIVIWCLYPMYSVNVLEVERGLHRVDLQRKIVLPMLYYSLTQIYISFSSTTTIHNHQLNKHMAWMITLKSKKSLLYEF